MACMRISGSCCQHTADHIFRIRLKDRAGKSNPAYSDLVFAKGNHAEFEMKLPLGEENAPWIFEAADVYSGLSGTLTLHP